MKKIVVIGGSGFMGSHLADELSRRGCAVTIFDRERSPWIRADQIFVEGDIRDRHALEKAMTGADAVYHYAGIADIGQAAANPIQTLEVNVIGTANILDLCVQLKVQRFMFASTVYVYSDRGSFYRVSKQATEAVIEAYEEKYGLKYTILRYGSLYGERSQAWNGLRRYVTQAVRDGKIDYQGTGKERREYIHVTDAARLSVDALGEKYVNKSLILTGNEVFESLQLLRLIEEVMGKKIDIRVSPSHTSKDHYEMTPYRYSAKVGLKIVANEFVDFPQGILRLIEEISQEIHSK